MCVLYVKLVFVDAFVFICEWRCCKSLSVGKLLVLVIMYDNVIVMMFMYVLSIDLFIRGFLLFWFIFFFYLRNLNV